MPAPSTSPQEKPSLPSLADIVESDADGRNDLIRSVAVKSYLYEVHVNGGQPGGFLSRAARLVNMSGAKVEDQERRVARSILNGRIRELLEVARANEAGPGSPLPSEATGIAPVESGPPGTAGLQPDIPDRPLG